MAKLWGKEISVDEQVSLLEDFSSYLEVSMLVTIEKFKSIIRLQKPGWLNDARDFLTDILPEVCDDIGQYLVKSKLMNPPNWKIFLKDRLEIAKEAGQSIYSYHEKCFQICASQYQQQYQATYEQELAKQEGLGFGIISSSLASHLVYAAQSARKEVENEKKASEAADRIMHSSLGPVEKATQMTIAFYHEKFDPFVNEFLIGFYSDIEKLIYGGLEIDKETLDNNKTLSDNELSNITEDNHRERIIASLSKYPFNGDALFWAVRYDDADDDLIQFCSANPLLLPKYLVAIEQSAVAYLKKQKEKADLYNRDPLTEDIIQLLQRIKAFLTDERMYGVSTYDDIIQEVYGEKIDLVCQKFDTLVKIKKTTSALINYAKSNKSIYIAKSDFETLVKYNAIFGTSKIKEVFDVIPDTSDAFDEMLSALRETIQAENAKYQEAERQRQQRERELADQKRREEEKRKEEERQAELRRQEELKKEKEIIKAKAKKALIIATPILAIFVAFIVILNTIIIPNSKYNNAVSLLNEEKYVDAYQLFLELGDFKDAQTQASNIKSKAEEQAANIKWESEIKALKECKVGDIVTLGTYEQDNDKSNGNEDIEWIVLEKDGDKVMLISKHILDCQSYHRYSKETTWENCTLRSWLNNTFYNCAFSVQEKNAILTTNVKAESVSKYAEAGNDTIDKVFLLSYSEAKKYFSTGYQRIAKLTTYAKIRSGRDMNSSDAHWWWLRTPGFDNEKAANVGWDGEVSDYGAWFAFSDYSDYGVRPVIWVDIG